VGDLFGTAGEVGTYPIGQARPRPTRRRFRPYLHAMRRRPKPTRPLGNGSRSGSSWGAIPRPADRMSGRPTTTLGFAAIRRTAA